MFIGLSEEGLASETIEYCYISPCSVTRGLEIATGVSEKSKALTISEKDRGVKT